MLSKFTGPLSRSPLLILLATLLLPAALVAACSSNKSTGGFTGTNVGGGNAGGGSGTGNSGSGMGGGGIIFEGGLPDVAECAESCSADHTAVVDCDGGIVTQCQAGYGCDLTTGGCTEACQAAVDNKQSVGCDYYATLMDMDFADQCFAAFVGNTWSTPAHLTVEFYPGTQLNLANFARIATGSGSNITYTAYDPTAGLAPGQVAILFLSGSSSSPQVPCPMGVTTAIPQGASVQKTGQGHSFHINSDVPVAAYQINPYGGGAAAITGASLLLPTSVWDTNYVAVTAAKYSSVTMDNPSFNIVASMDNTMVTILPSVAITGGGGMPAGAAGVPYTFTLNTGEQAQFSQQTDLTGTVIQASNPVGFMAGNACMQAPLGTSFCDHGEQMLPPVKALGNEYVAVQFRPRVTGDQAIWHMVGTIAGTNLTYSSNVGGPASLSAGQIVDFTTDQPFVVQSQDAKHPFMLFTYMTGSQATAIASSSVGTNGYGDPDFVLSVPPQQYLSDYVFFTDLTYPETNLVVVRAKNKGGTFDDVTLDCAGTLTGWAPVGDYEWTRIDLMRHNFAPQGNCSNGPHEMKSAGLFGLWVWGWGSPETTTFTANVSYGYPGGMNVSPINSVVIPPQQM